MIHSLHSVQLNSFQLALLREVVQDFTHNRQETLEGSRPGLTRLSVHARQELADLNGLIVAVFNDTDLEKDLAPVNAKIPESLRNKKK